MNPTITGTTMRIAAGTPEFKRINRAMVFGGFSTFSLLYCIQPLMPLLAQQFTLTPAQSSLTLSISTLTLALSLLISSAISERLGRKPLMVFALATAAATTVLCAFAHNFSQLLLLRALLGIALGGMPAVAIAYLDEEIEAASIGLAIGLYIAGSAFGGMLGRLLTAVISDHYSWRMALGIMGTAGLYAAWEFWRSLPQARNFKPAGQIWETVSRGLRTHFSDAGLMQLFFLAFLLMGCFVSLYNYIGYRLLAAPFNLSQSSAGAIALLYLLGIGSSVWVGRLVDRVGRRGVLWIVLLTMLSGLLLTLSSSLYMIIPGMALFTFGFFASHSVASSWVARRATAPKALASAIYLCFYYLGSSLIGSFTGLMWASHGWSGVVLALGAILSVALMITLRLRNLQPLVV
ncbi:MFS transporter [Undibacterium sp. TJN19]|uniref:MFS transporter n=1 Tax=Undibacterium sp. TJN19 TaxID=3413055 RepID=UPI003BF44EAB